MIFLIALVLLFFALNLGAAIAAVIGLVIGVIQLACRNKSIWFRLVAHSLLLGGSGALGGSWGLYYAATQYWTHTDWPELAWASGYISGGMVGIILSFGFLVWSQREDAKRVRMTIVDCFYTLKEELSELPR